MAFGPVNVSGADLKGVLDAVKAAEDAAAAAQKAASDAKAVSENLENAIKNGDLTISTKPVFPVVSADPVSPVQGEAWIMKSAPEENKEETSNG